MGCSACDCLQEPVERNNRINKNSNKSKKKEILQPKKGADVYIPYKEKIKENSKIKEKLDICTNEEVLKINNEEKTKNMKNKEIKNQFENGENNPMINNENIKIKSFPEKNENQNQKNQNLDPTNENIKSDREKQNDDNDEFNKENEINKLNNQNENIDQINRSNNENDKKEGKEENNKKEKNVDNIKNNSFIDKIENQIPENQNLDIIPEKEKVDKEKQNGYENYFNEEIEINKLNNQNENNEEINKSINDNKNQIKKSMNEIDRIEEDYEKNFIKNLDEISKDKISEIQEIETGDKKEQNKNQFENGENKSMENNENIKNNSISEKIENKNHENQNLNITNEKIKTDKEKQNENINELNKENEINNLNNINENDEQINKLINDNNNKIDILLNEKDEKEENDEKKENNKKEKNEDKINSTSEKSENKNQENQNLDIIPEKEKSDKGKINENINELNEENENNKLNSQNENNDQINKSINDNKNQINKSINEKDKKEEKEKNDEKVDIFKNEENNKKEEQEKKELIKNLNINTETNIKKDDEEENSSFKDPRIELTEEKKNNIDKILQNTPKREETTLELLLNYFKTNSNNLSQIEKAWLLYKWTALNIEYDHIGCENGSAGHFHKITIGSITAELYDKTEEEIFKAGKGVCLDYSRLFKKMAEFLNLESNIIIGNGKGEGDLVGEVPDKENHAWNSVKINDNWYLIDVTWARIKGDTKNIKFDYFCTNPEIFIRSHFPQEEKWQLLKKTVKIEDYSKMINIKQTFFELGFKKIFPDLSILKIDKEGKIKMSFDKTKKIKLLVKLFRNEGNAYYDQSGRVFIEKFDENYFISYLIDKRGDYKLIIFGNDGSLDTYPELVTYQINGTNKNKIKLNYPIIGYFFLNQEFQLIEPRHKDLIKNSKVDFKIKVNSNIENLSIKFQNNELKMNKIEDNIYELKDVLIESNLSVCAYEKGKNFQRTFLNFNVIEKCNLLESVIEKAAIDPNQFSNLGFISIDPDVSRIKTNEKGQIKVFFDKSKNVGLIAQIGIEENGLLKYSDKNITVTKLDDYFLVEFKVDKPDEYELRLCGLRPSVNPNNKNYVVMTNIKIIPEDY